MRIGFGKIFWGMVLIIIGVLYLFDSLGYMDFNLWHSLGKLWPLILIFLGLSIIFRRGGKFCNPHHYQGNNASRFIGDIRLDFSAGHIGDARASNFIGDIDLTVKNNGPNSEEGKLSVSSFIGDITITLPTNLPFMVRQSSFLGDHKVDGATMVDASDGHFKTENFDNSQGRLIISISSFIGDSKIFVR